MELTEDQRDLELGVGLGSLVLNREPNARMGVAHNGVGIFYRKAVGDFKTVQIPYPEVLPAVSTIRGSARKLVAVAAYIPLNYAVPWAKQCLE